MDAQHNGTLKQLITDTYILEYATDIFHWKLKVKLFLLEIRKVLMAL